MFGLWMMMLLHPPLGSQGRRPNAHAPHADGRHDVAPVGQLGRLHDTRDRGDVEARVATADLTSPLDEDHAELVVTLEDVAHHQSIPRLEHVQREQRVREQHSPEREHRHRDDRGGVHLVAVR